jgi:hypothetical protein
LALRRVNGRRASGKVSKTDRLCCAIHAGKML